MHGETVKFKSSSPYSQVPTTCPYPEPTPSSPHNPLPLLKIHLNVILINNINKKTGKAVL
jgi:hypothetical protein